MRGKWKAGSEAGGFTLVELLVVVAVLAVIVAIAIPMFAKYKLRGYKAALDYDAKSVYTSAQAYLTDNMGATVDTVGELQTGGYNASPYILFVNGSLMANSGNIELISNVLKTHGKDNNSVIFYNGRIAFVNSPN
ncbi:MAG: prepilin-type N-terminal cleavage/methylation domain-containing protein [Thermodesulfobacteriota bacterium]